MAITISQAFVAQFAETVRHLAQQGDTRVRPHVSEVALTGEAYNFDRLGETTALTKSGTRVATPFVDSPWSRRVARPVTKHWADTIENEDKVKMLIDPQSAYAQSGGMSMRRGIDDVIIAAADGTAEDGDGGSNALPAGQVIGTPGAMTTGLTLDVITQTNEIFQANDVDPDEPKCWLTSPTEVREMLNTDKLTNADYQSVKALSANGMIQNFMGFTFVLTNRLTITAGANNSRANLAFTKKGIGLAVNNDIFVRIAERADLSHLIQVYLEFTMGATRTEDEHVVQVNVSEAYVAPA